VISVQIEQRDATVYEGRFGLRKVSDNAFWEEIVTRGAPGGEIIRHH